MNKPDMIEAISRETGMSRRQVRKVLTEFFHQLELALLRNESYREPSFGEWLPVIKASRKGRNSVTGEMFVIPQCYGVKFVTSTALRDRLNE